MKKKIIIVLGTKGGCGKTTTSINLCMVAAHRGLDFEYIEIDNSNDTSSTLKNSKVFQNKMISIKTSKAQEELYKATFKALKENKTVIVDIGGGLDTVEIVELLKSEFEHIDIDYILPFENSYKQMQNLINTYAYIDNEVSTYLLKNKVIKHKHDKDPFIFFEGDKKQGIKSVKSELKPKNKVFEMYLSDQLQIAEITEESMLDLAQEALEYTKEEAHEIFMDSAADMVEYEQLMQRYSKATKSLKEIEILSEEFAELFEAGANDE